MFWAFLHVDRHIIVSLFFHVCQVRLVINPLKCWFSQKKQVKTATTSLYFHGLNILILQLLRSPCVFSITSRAPVEGKSSVCLICIEYRMIILMIVIITAWVKYYYRILQTHHARTHACARTRAHACASTHTPSRRRTG